MRHNARLFILSAILVLGACSGRDDTATVADAPVASKPDATVSPVENAAPVDGGCDHTKAAWAVGQTADGGVLERARLDAGAEVARFLRPGQAVTMDFSARRLNLDVDAKNTVTGARCG